MSQKSGITKSSSERSVKDIRRATRKQYSAEEKIRIVLDGLRGEHSIAELCRREGIAESPRLLHLVRSGRMAGQTQHGSCARRPMPSADTGKIERWHQTLKNRILLENYYLPGGRRTGGFQRIGVE